MRPMQLCREASPLGKYLISITVPVLKYLVHTQKSVVIADSQVRRVLTFHRTAYDSGFFHLRYPVLCPLFCKPHPPISHISSRVLTPILAPIVQAIHRLTGAYTSGNLTSTIRETARAPSSRD